MSERTGLYWNDWVPQTEFSSGNRTVTAADIETFANLSGDRNPLHVDADFARRSPYRKNIAHGQLVAAVVAGLAHDTGKFDGTVMALTHTTGKFLLPVFADDTLTAIFRVQACEDQGKASRGIVIFRISILNQKDEEVATLGWSVMFKKRK